MAAAHNDIFIKTIGVLQTDTVKKCGDKTGTKSVMIGSVSSYNSIKVDARRWNLRKYQGTVKRCSGTPNRSRAAGYNDRDKSIPVQDLHIVYSPNSGHVPDSVLVYTWGHLQRDFRPGLTYPRTSWQ